MIELNKIRIDGGTQSRTAVSDEVISEYATAITDGATMPPVVVFFDGVDNWLADGFHRYHAYRKAGLPSIPATIKNGTCREAKLHAAGSNGAHGFRRTNADKRRAVQMVLEDEDCAQTWTDREIAKHCAVSHSFVAAIRNPEKAATQQANREKSFASKVQKVESDSTQDSNKYVKVESDSTHNDKVVIPDVKNPTKASTDAEAEYTEFDAAMDQISDLQAELVVARMGDVPEEQKQQATELINELRSEIKTLNAHLSAVTLSRDTLLEENSQLKKQCSMYRQKLEKLKV